MLIPPHVFIHRVAQHKQQASNQRKGQIGLGEGSDIILKSAVYGSAVKVTAALLFRFCGRGTCSGPPANSTSISISMENAGNPGGHR